MSGVSFGLVRRRSGFHCPLFVLALLLFFNVAHAQPLSLCDYAPPRSELGDLNTVVDFRAFNSPGRDNTIYSGTFKLDGVYLYDVQTLGFTLNSSIKLDLGDATLNNVDTSPNFKLFVGDSDFFTFLGLDVQGIGPISLDHFTYSVLTGYGYGRFRDVTAFAQALNIQNQLLRLGRLAESLPVERLEHIADLITSQPSDAPLSQLINDIQQTLENSGILLGPLAAPGLLSIEQILEDGTSTNFCGWETSLGLSVGSQSENVLGLFAFKYALAPAPRSQLSLDTRLSFAPDVFGSPLGTFFLDAQMTYTYRLSEFINSTWSYDFLRSSTRGSSPIEVQSLNISIGFTNIVPSLSLLLELDWSLATGTPGWSRTINLNVGYEIF